MNFTYKAKDSKGKVVEGDIEASSQFDAISKLKSQKLSVINISQTKKKKLKGGKVSSKDIVIFSRQLSTLVSSGVPIIQSLSILESQAENKNFAQVIATIKKDIEGGLSISDAMAKHPKVFSELYVSMIRAGELGGILDTILDRLSSYLESAAALRDKVKSALMYPMIVGGIAVVITVFLIIFVIPIFKNIFQGFGAELPLITRIVIGASDFMKYNIIYILLALGGGFYGVKRYIKTEKGRMKFDSIILKLPVFGIILKKVAIAKFSRTLGTLIKSGVPILQGLETVAKTSGNKVIEEIILGSMKSIREGGKISEPLKKNDVFPSMVVQMIAVGEETGSLDNMLFKIADFYDQEVDSAVKGLTSMIEPLVMVFMGTVIGFIVIAMFIPMFQMGEIASKAG
ncbi:MAG TPA: type II secretion system F family protein [Elusimicrobiales bacterium]|nr:type II secretion system F family protein [Elusimicrobiales bacterium]HOL62957.1 type II secretion system F family protein [Elusimicrobiales bacterium]HPO95769.1 type II secretion system F family protein [Elusimicrobiales bacterium]